MPAVGVLAAGQPGGAGQPVPTQPLLRVSVTDTMRTTDLLHQQPHPPSTFLLLWTEINHKNPPWPPVYARHTHARSHTPHPHTQQHTHTRVREREREWARKRKRERCTSGELKLQADQVNGEKDSFLCSSATSQGVSRFPFPPFLALSDPPFTSSVSPCPGLPHIFLMRCLYCSPCLLSVRRTSFLIHWALSVR